jgi:hypothetical protein
VLLLLGVAGVVLAPAVRPRLLALTVLGVALLELVAPVAAYMYDARFALPAFGVLSSAAAIGLGQIAQRLGAIQWGWVRSGAGSVTPRRPG